MSIPRWLSVVIAFALAPSCAGRPAQEAAAEQPAAQRRSLFDPDLHMRSADVRPGMTGWGLSVFKGTNIERFEVEVLAVLRRSEQINTDVILVRASGANLEHTGPIAGMSGSPIYLHCDDGKDRLLGAFAFGWPGVKDPIAGVQPIEAMLELDPNPKVAPVGQAALAAGDQPQWDVRSSRAIAKLMGQQPRSLAELLSAAGFGPTGTATSLPGGLEPLGLPMGAAGLAPGAVRELSGALSAIGAGRLLPLNAAAQPTGPSEADRIEPGSSLVVPALLGDLNLIATGTCTTVIGDQVFGFGHPLLGEGPTALPMAAGAVNAVIPTTDISFKIGSAGKVLGTLASDAQPGIAGRLGPVPGMIPVRINVKRGAEQEEYEFQAARHPMLTLAALSSATQSATEFRGMPDMLGATRWDITLAFSGGRKLRLRDVGPNQSPFGGNGIQAAMAMPLAEIETNPFARIELESVQMNLEMIEAAEAQLAAIEQIALSRARYRPGEVVNVNLTLRLFRGGRVQRTMELKLPENLPPGEYPLSVTDSIRAVSTAAETRPYDFNVNSIDDLLAVMNSLQNYGTDAVYLRLDRPEQVRVAVGREALADLPNSRALLLAQSGRSDVAMYGPALTSKLEVPYVVTEGEAQTMITVIRP